MSEQRFDVIYGEFGPRVDYHFCRTWEGDEGCYGTNLNHGLTWEAVREELAAWHEREAARWRALTHDEWNPPDAVAVAL